MSKPEFDVVIVGAGIAGGALVRALAQQDLRLALVEARPVTAALEAPAVGLDGFDSRVSAITPASQSLLQSLGVWESITATRACPYRQMHVWDGEGSASIDFDAGELDAPVLGHIIENRVLTGALLEDIDQRSELTVFSPARLQNLQREATGACRLQLEDGRELTCQLLVAADGALSRVRQLADFRTREWDYGHHALVASVETERYHQATAYQRFMTTGPLAFLPLASQGDRHYSSIVWSAKPDLAESLQALSDEEFCAELGRSFEHRLGGIRAVSPRFAFPLRQRHAIDYVQPGIALVGDAAHTIHPLAGQGINLGLLDVAALSEELSRALGRGHSIGAMDVLSRYQRRRKGENMLMMTAMDGFKRLFEEQSLPLRWLRNTGMRLVGRAGPLKQQLMRHAMGIR
jgi:2-octaprenylphenol hydroxylase